MMPCSARPVSGCPVTRSNGIRRPVGAYVGKHLGGAGELMAHQHGHAVEAVVFGSDDKRYAHPFQSKELLSSASAVSPLGY